MVLMAVFGVAIAAYVSWTRLAGAMPPCGPTLACDTMEASGYSSVLGVPVALLGLGASVVTLAGSLRWWVRVDRRGLVFAYLTGLAGLPVLVWLAYLEFAVIRAVCALCIAYAAAAIGGWTAAAAAMADGEQAHA